MLVRYQLIITRATHFLPKNLKFWLYNLQILTLLWLINFLRLQLQSNSAVGVEVNPEAYSCAPCFKILKYLVVLLWWWYIGKYINNSSRVKPEIIIKLKRCMHNGLSIYQTKYCKTMFLALLCLSYILLQKWPNLLFAWPAYRKSQVAKSRNIKI